MNTLSSLLKWIGNTIGANPNTLKTSNKTLVGAINEMTTMLYPVGCYFWTSSSSFNPATTFGGTWEKMNQGIVLVSAGTSYPIKTGVAKDGGNANAIVVSHTHTFTKPTVTVPAHTHSFTQPSITGGSCTISSSGGHSHTVSVKYRANYLQGGDNRDSVNSTGTETATSIATIASGTGTHTHTVPSHTHTASGGAVGSKAAFSATVSGGSVGSAGSSGTGANMPPYKAAYCWHRIA